MHVPDHLINNPVEVAALVSAGAAIAAVALTQQRRDAEPKSASAPDWRTILISPERIGAQLATAALIFALQMVNFGVTSGTSGHLLGGALATALIGPRRALVVMTSVVCTQALLFADGGAGALGVNLWLIAIVPVAVAAALGSLVGTRTQPRQWVTIGLAAALGPVIASLGFATFYMVGGTTQVGLGQLATSMVGVHLLIGIGEAAMTLGILALMLAMGARSHVDTAPVWATAVGSATLLSLVASSQPDGLERVGADLGFALSGPGSILSASPLADYQFGLLDGRPSVAIGGVVGIIVTCALCAALTRISGSHSWERRATVTA